MLVGQSFTGEKKGAVESVFFGFCFFVFIFRCFMNKDNHHTIEIIRGSKKTKSFFFLRASQNTSPFIFKLRDFSTNKSPFFELVVVQESFSKYDNTI